VLGGQTVADSRDVRMLHLSGTLPRYCFPERDVRLDLLEPSARRDNEPLLGPVRHWTVRAGDRVAEDAAFGWPEPEPGAPPVDGLVSLQFAAMDEWWEEDERVYVHPVDPYHRVDVRQSTRHLMLSLDGHVLAETRQPLMLFETGLPTRYYFPREDVKGELVPSETHTQCPYKGEASYWSVRVGERVEKDLVWCYREPLPEVGRIAGLVAFFTEWLDLDVDGERQERPGTPWSR
jgi:uncharacterized protein (DUF427 family)